MPLTEEQESQILEDFLVIFYDKYGARWREHLTTNLRPSPIHQIAEQRGVTVSDVKKVRAKLLRMGLLFQVFQTTLEQMPPT